MKKQADRDLDGEKERTPRQNKALHLYFQKVADMLNEAGLDMRRVLKPDVEIPWTKDSVKQYMWKPIQKVMLGIDSTADMSTKDLDPVFETMNRHLAKHGIHQPFPSIESIIEAQRIEEAKRMKKKK